MYQNIFNEHLKKIRLVCSATGQEALGNTIVGLMFDFSDDLKDNNLILDTDKDNQYGNEKPNF